MLLLDEPTNHLDAESVSWLERFLKDFTGTIVAITHDRYFLDNVAEGRETWRQVFITRGQLELVVQLEAAAPAAPVPTVPVGELPPVVDAAEEPMAEDPPATAPPAAEPAVAERPTPPPATPREPRTTTTAMSTSTPSTPRTTTGTMRSTHTLVRDPGF